MTQQHEGQLVPLGKISGVFGVKGWLKVFSDTRPRENIVNYSHWWLEPLKAGARQRYRLESGRRSGKYIIAKLADVDDRDAAGELTGSTISIENTELPVLSSNEFYWKELVGMAVTNASGQQFGQVSRILETGTHDVLVVKDTAGRETLIPWVMQHFIERVDISEKLIVVDWEVDWND